MTEKSKTSARKINSAFYTHQGNLNTKSCNNIHSTYATIQNPILIKDNKKVKGRREKEIKEEKKKEREIEDEKKEYH